MDHLEALNRVISIQSELIAHLKSEIERLKAFQTSISAPYTISNYPTPFVGFPSTGSHGWVSVAPSAPFTITSVDGSTSASVVSGFIEGISTTSTTSKIQNIPFTNL